MREVINDDDYWARRFAYRDAFKRHDVNVLIRGLTDPDHRSVVATYLGKLESPEARLPLEDLLKASDSDVRAAAVIALGRIGAAESIPLLVNTAWSDQAMNVRDWAVNALGVTGREEALAHLLALIEADDPQIRRSALNAIRLLNDRRALPEIRRQSRTVPPWRRLRYWRTIAQLRVSGRA